MTKLLVFRVAGQEFGAELTDVREVIVTPAITSLPRAKPPVVGVFNLRGSIVTALDGAALLGLADAGEPSRIVVAEVDGHRVGVLVEDASEVLTVDDDEVRPPPEVGVRVGRGVVLREERAIVILDLRLALSLDGATLATVATEGST